MDAPDPDFRHDLPDDLAARLGAHAALAGMWDDLTALARNDYICWVISAKKDETRRKRLARLEEEVLGGKRRPCCFPGCPHRLASARGY